VGQLYIANPSSAFVDYQVNGGAIPLPGRPFANGPKPPPYTPYFVFAGIERDLGPGIVGYGSNVLSATFRDMSGPREHYTFTFTVQRGAWSIEDDLIAYVCRGLLMLMTPRGMRLPPNPLLIKAQPASPAGAPTTSTTPTPL
jgi:hypothetical protein